MTSRFEFELHSLKSQKKIRTYQSFLEFTGEYIRYCVEFDAVEEDEKLGFEKEVFRLSDVVYKRTSISEVLISYDNINELWASSFDVSGVSDSGITVRFTERHEAERLHNLLLDYWMNGTIPKL